MDILELLISISTFDNIINESLNVIIFLLSNNKPFFISSDLFSGILIIFIKDINSETSKNPFNSKSKLRNIFEYFSSLFKWISQWVSIILLVTFAKLI